MDMTYGVIHGNEMEFPNWEVGKRAVLVEKDGKIKWQWRRQ